MQYLQEGLAAYEAQQYSEALFYFQQALPSVKSPVERERVLMWIACSSLAIGNDETLIGTCPSLLGSADAQVRRFARSTLKQYGMIDPTKHQAPSILGAATDQYFKHFWALQNHNFQLLIWLVVLGTLVFIWSTFTLDHLHSQIPTWRLQNAQQLWWSVLVYFPPGIALLIFLERSRVAVQSQKAMLYNSSAQGKLQALAALLLTISLFGLITWFHQPLGCFLGLCLEPWWVCLSLGLWAKK